GVIDSDTVNVAITRDHNRFSQATKAADYSSEKTGGGIRQAAAISLAFGAIKRYPMWSAAGAYLKQIVPALAGAGHIGLHAPERIRIAKQVELTKQLKLPGPVAFSAVTRSAHGTAPVGTRRRHSGISRPSSDS